MNLSSAREPLAFVDLETTGANFANDRIIEIGIVEVDPNGSREWNALVNPGRPVSDFITGLTGISTAMLSSAPTFEQLASVVLEKLRGHLFIAHNARFDYTFLKREFKRIGIEFRAPSLCTVKLSRKLFPQHHRHSLDTLRQRFDIAAGERHRALADARVIWKLWQCWHQILPAEDIRNAVDVIVGRPDLPPQIDSAIIEELPEAAGAYGLYGEDKRLLLTKRSANIRQQVLAHFSSANRNTALWRDTWYVKWLEAAGELGAKLNEFKLTCCARQTAEDLCSWQLVQLGDGDFRPHLVYSRDIDFALASDLFGLYRNRREALYALRKIAESHRLCNNLIGIGTGSPGEACVDYKQGTCRGACIGKERLSLHSARLMTALAKSRLSRWPYAGPVALIERDEFGMREDYHLVENWRHLGTVHDEAALYELIEIRSEGPFEPEIYRIINKYIKAGKTRVLPLLQALPPVSSL